MSSSSSLHNDVSVELSNALATTNTSASRSSSTGDLEGDISSRTALTSSHPQPRRSIPNSGEESPLLRTSASLMQGIHEGLHVRENVARNTTTSSNSVADYSLPPSLHSLEEGSVTMSSSSFLSSQNLQSTAPPVFEVRSSSRRRRPLQNRQRRNASTNNSAILSNTSATTVGSSNTNYRRPGSTTEAAVSRRNNNNNTNSLRVSLDAGMAAVQRWIRSRSSNSVTSEPSSGRSVSWSSNNRESTSEVVSLSSRSATATIGQHGADEDMHVGPGHRSIAYGHPTIFEEDEDALGRQRALSESDALRIRDFFRSMRGSGQTRRRRSRRSGSSENNDRQLSLSAAAALHTSTGPGVQGPENATNAFPPSDLLLASPGLPSLRERSVTDGALDSFRSLEHFETSRPARRENLSVSSGRSVETGEDPERQARVRWIQINRRFQIVITFVALLFSLLLFAILICWVVLTSSYVVSFDKSCDVPLKTYFWLLTFQLVLDVFRADIMRCVLSWDSSSNQRMPSRVIFYNVIYLAFALFVLRLGIRSVFLDSDSKCRTSAPELFNASTAFVVLSLCAWATILFGYLCPFLVVATMLTCNGYNPSSPAHQGGDGATQPVFPAAYTTTGAPPGTVEFLHALRIEDFPDDYPRECCICMESLSQKPVVETACKHVFHKQCCREWLRQARSCPVCRMDIPSTLGNCLPTDDSSVDASAVNETSRIPLGPTGRPVVGLWRALRTQSMSFGGNVASQNHVENRQGR